MSHFTLDRQITEATRMDAPIQKGPVMRWQRKQMEGSMRSMSLESKHGSLYVILSMKGSVRLALW